MRPNEAPQPQNAYRQNRSYDDICEPRWKVVIENRSYYFLDYSKALRCYQQFWEATEPVQVSYNQYIKDPSR